jgi:hypothetical protein
LSESHAISSTNIISKDKVINNYKDSIIMSTYIQKQYENISLVEKKKNKRKEKKEKKDK